jgi:4-alpha-glucanotransferase
MTRRASGILLHPTSLPGPYGIGDLGKDARFYLHWLQEAGQTIWQMLPLVPPGAGHSPYDGSSAFAGNPMLTSPADLVDVGFLKASDLDGAPDFGSGSVQFERVGAWKTALLRLAWRRFQDSGSAREKEQFESWASESEQSPWLDDWALFASLKNHFNGEPWSEWPPDLRAREASGLEAARRELQPELGYHKFVQYLFASQWSRLKAAAAQSGVRLLGDMPFYVALDSADVWAHRDLFKVSADGLPTYVAGVPPDYFSSTGQRWGNPVFEWQRHEANGFRWWTQRVGFSLALYDMVRIDHFRAFSSYWEIDANEPTAVHGHWEPGPGLGLFERLREVLGELPLVAEDLGLITPEVKDLKRQLGLPGMKVLQFGFDSHDSEHLPHNFTRDTVAYTGTHDNDTAAGWLDQLAPEQYRSVLDYVGGDGAEAHWDLIRSILNSVADLAILPMQDVLGLGSQHRMNTPASCEGNWGWRLQPDMADTGTAARLRRLAVLSGRFDPDSQEPRP